MHRRGAGIAAIKKKNLAQARYKDKGTELASEQLTQLSKQLDSFRSYLEDFASKHKGEIRKDADFRRQFQEMCAAIGVDPLASGKGFWSEMLGYGDFYYELGVQIIEVCMATNHRNGGLIDIEELRLRLIASTGRNRQDITTDDLLMAIKKLKVLGNGFTIIPTGRSQIIQSVPRELTLDHTAVLKAAEGKAFVTSEELQKELKWEKERSYRALDYMVKEGLAWVDDQSRPHQQYWFPGLFSDSMAAA
ncbi:hypothetical protein CAPTEDRAFT_177076 [Capitella teleta]|uniref:Vacuolar-sorting protein SNF8 n=1 Tax=Capitella teleta TaxID=283909 RepID=R7V0X9_CAPTE|nr:hypothetical protein CAPTEDRAFT_177076 [Capitella teleta]|eukprot:ELU12152.1 hypothetical protein CAPTEDRAFT_177076 [Capitella teleta]